jgi:hypothetical protein
MMTSHTLTANLAQDNWYSFNTSNVSRGRASLLPGCQIHHGVVSEDGGAGRMLKTLTA